MRRAHRAPRSHKKTAPHHPACAWRETMRTTRERGAVFGLTSYSTIAITIERIFYFCKGISRHLTTRLLNSGSLPLRGGAGGLTRVGFSPGGEARAVKTAPEGLTTKSACADSQTLPGVVACWSKNLPL